MKRSITMMLLLSLLFYAGCAPRAPEKEPPPTIPEPATEKPIAPKDEQMYMVYSVLKRFGRKIQSHISYDRYRQLVAQDGLSSWSPDWFYDSYRLPLNEKGHWVVISYHTAADAVKADPRIAKRMADVPHHAIDLRLQDPRGDKYVLTDAEADGVLDFAAPDRGDRIPTSIKKDTPLVQKMQGKYTWILSIIKKSYTPSKKGQRPI